MPGGEALFQWLRALDRRLPHRGFRRGTGQRLGVEPGSGGNVGVLCAARSVSRAGHRQLDRRRSFIHGRRTAGDRAAGDDRRPHVARPIILRWTSPSLPECGGCRGVAGRLDGRCSAACSWPSARRRLKLVRPARARHTSPPGPTCVCWSTARPLRLTCGGCALKRRSRGGMSGACGWR